MSLEIVHYNHPVLRRKGDKITVFDAALARLGKEMIESMHQAGGIGLAAQQVGLALKVCVVDLRESDAEYAYELDGAKPPIDLFMPMVIVNPVVTVVGDAREVPVEEGCLSFPEIRGDVFRPPAISVRFQDEMGRAHSLTCDGLLARCIQHEADHLNGVLFIDRMEKKTRQEIDERVRGLAKRTRDEAKENA